jgi:DNA-binding NtrC family response regulator
MTDKIKLLVVDDEVKFLNSVAKRLELRGFDVTRAAGGQEAIDYSKKGRFDLALLDLKMPGVDGKKVLEILKKQNDFIEVIIMTGHGSSSMALECMKMGAFSYLPKPYELEKTLEILRQAYAARLKKEYQSDPQMVEKLIDLVGRPDPMEALRSLKELAG